MAVAPTDTYQIEFDTKDRPGIITAVSVTLKTSMHPMRSKEDMQKTFRIDLVDHPLYPALERYVKANPSSNPRKK